MKILGACLIVLLRAYQLMIAPVFISLGVACRFEPSCSRYAVEAVRKHGSLKGSLLAAGRLARCHPFCEGGHDPVPSNAAFLCSVKELNG